MTTTDRPGRLARLRTTASRAASSAVRTPERAAVVLVDNALVVGVFAMLAVVVGAAGVAYTAVGLFAPTVAPWAAATVAGVLLTAAAVRWSRMTVTVEEPEDQ